MNRFMDLSQALAKRSLTVVSHHLPFRSCQFSSLNIDGKGFRLYLVNGEWWVHDTASFLEALRIPELIVVEASSQINEVVLQVIDGAAAHGISLICEPHVFYHDTFPYRMMFALSAPLSGGTELRFWASINIELEV